MRNQDAENGFKLNLKLSDNFRLFLKKNLKESFSDKRLSPRAFLSSYRTIEKHKDTCITIKPYDFLLKLDKRNEIFIDFKEAGYLTIKNPHTKQDEKCFLNKKDDVLSILRTVLKESVQLLLGKKIIEPLSFGDGKDRTHVMDQLFNETISKIHPFSLEKMDVDINEYGIITVGFSLSNDDILDFQLGEQLSKLIEDKSFKKGVFRVKGVPLADENINPDFLPLRQKIKTACDNELISIAKGCLR